MFTISVVECRVESRPEAVERVSQIETASNPCGRSVPNIATDGPHRPGSAEDPMSASDDDEAESYNPWSVVNLVFTHLTDQGLHPVLGESGDPGPPATALLVALGIEPAPEGNREVMRGVRAHLEEIREAMFEGD
jgi:hypothetical protein